MPSQLNDAISYYNLAVIFDQKGLLKEAETSYRRAISLKPDYLKAYSNLGCILVKLDKLEEAVKVYQTALAISPNWATLHNNLGQALQAQGKAGDALSAYLTAIALQPNMVLAHYNAGKVWQLEGEHLQAGRCFQRVIELAPDNVSAYSDWGYSLMASGKLDAAMECFQKAISHQPAFVEAYCQQFLQPEEQKKQEIDELQQAKIACARFLDALQKPFISTEIYAYLWQTYVHLGNVLFEYGSYRQAENYYHQALQIEPKNPEIYLKLSQCLGKQKRQNAALLVSFLAKMSPSAARFAKNNQSSLTTSPQGVYLSAKEWVTATELKGAEYVEVCLEDEKGSQESGFVYEDTKFEQQTREKDPFRPISEENLTLNKLPDSETLEKECGGLNCAPCLKRIYQQLSPIYEESGIQVFDNNRSQLCFNSPNTFVTVIPEGRAWVVPQKNYWMICNAIGIISPDNYLLADMSREYPGSLPGCHRHDPNKHRIFNIEELPPIEKIDASVAVLSGLSGNVYFHWMVDILPRLNILRQSKIEFSKIDKFLINSITQPFQRETLSLLGIPSSKIIESDLHPHIQAKKLIVPSFAGHLGWVEPASLKFLRQELLKQISLQNLTYPERIYISRGKARYRRVLNEEELINYLEKFGFQSVTLEEIAVAEQITLFYHAKIIVAPHGSGLTNIIFCQTGTKIIELTSPHYVRHYYPVISQLLGLQHYYLIGEAFACYPLRELMYQNPLTEDIKLTKSQLEAMIKIIGLNNYPTSENTANSMETIVNSQLNAVKLNEQAEAYLKQGKLKEAETICRQVLAVQPQSAPAFKTLGNVLQATGKIEEAKECYKKSLIIEPNYAAVYANLGSLAAQQKEWEAAISYYQKAIQLDPKLGAAYRNLAKVWTQLNKPVEAAECWYGAFSLEPDKFTVQECVNLGNTLVSQEKIEEGILCYRHALKFNPNLLGVYQNLGEALKRQGKLEEAKVYYRKAEEVERKAGNKLELTKANNGAISSQKSINSVGLADAEACIALAEFYSKKGKWLEAIAACQQAISLQPASADAYKILGKGLQFSGQLETAKQCYLKALEIQPNLAEVYANLGSLAAQQESWQEAILYSQKALQINPQLVPVYRNLAKVFDRMGLPAESALWSYNAQRLEQSLEPASGTAEKYLLLGNKQLLEGNVDEAVKCYQQAITLNSNMSPAYHNLGEILSTKQQWDEAIKAYREAIKVKPDNAGSHYGLAKALSAQKNWQEAVVAYRQAISFNPNSAAIYHQLGDALSQLQQWEEAVKAYYQAIELNQDNSWSYNNLGDALIKLERWEEAVTVYRRAIELNPDFFWSHQNLGDTLIKLQRWDEAVAAYRKAITLNSESAQTYYSLADALVKLGECDEAVACYEKILQLQPETAGIQQKIHEIKHQIDKQINTQEKTEATSGFTQYPHSIVLTGSEKPFSLERKDSKTIKIAEQDILCFMVVRNESLRLPYCLSYYRQQGVAKFFVVDNDSTDETLSYLLKQRDVYVWHTKDAFSQSRCGTNWTELLLKTYGEKHWCLIVDPDEILYYQNCEDRSLSELCEELDRQGKKGLTAILLDMYSDKPIKETHYSAGQDPLEICPFFDRKFYHYKTDNFYGRTHQTSYFGGVRQRVFGNESIDGQENIFYCLNKVPLIKYDSSIEIEPNFHWTSCIELAEETGCLLHFKYFSNFAQYVQEEEQRKEHWNEGIQYAQYAKSLRQNEQINLYDPKHSVRFRNSQQLINLGIMQGVSSLNEDSAIGSEENYNLGQEKEKNQEWEEAIFYYEKVLSHNPQHPWAHNNLGLCLLRLKRWEEAISAYRCAINIKPDFAWSHYNLASAFKELGQWQEAVDHYRQALQLNQDLPYIYQQLGEALQKVAKSYLNEAMECFRQGIKAQPDNVEIYHKALEIQPNESQLYVELANALVRKNEFNQAIGFYHVALQINPNLAEAHCQLGKVAEKQGDVKRAIASYRQAIDCNSNAGRYYFYLGKVLQKQGKSEEAIIYYQKATQFDLDSDIAYEELAKFWIQNQNWEASLAAVRKSIQLNPNSAICHKNLGDILAKQRKIQEASAAYSKAIQLGFSPY
ncbi:tetratricopeptide repeat protein [Ancylothrix sp. C2]|uniref:tetratricopeptide repeat protein n=1 Tax=Ancylothrix sp. D3o TaxID=2953691 RepID=UPI0021BB1931|nr:tetratricopeptide repeat protein [Ancylothrix sp. D3o]MCT7952789.1 tetratricopeptide repeat protein [Ancylothrix sp. D3o]